MSKTILSPKSFLTYSLGCRVNQAEMEKLSLQLLEYGLSNDIQSPELILLNTCVVTQKAEKETRQKIRELKNKFPKSFLVVLGCGVTAKEKFGSELPQADLFVSNQDKDRVVSLLKEKFNLERKNIKTILSNKYTMSGRKFIKIQDGCQNNCSFCLTCHLRSKPKSFSPQSIIKQINYWTKQDIKEIILTGINLGLYQNLVKLLEEIQKQTKVERISFSSIYPEMLTKEFLKIVVGNPRFTQSFHLSLQSGSQSVLQRMNRKTNLLKLEKIINQIKKQNPFFNFKADIIVGFPDETEKEFKQTLDFIKEAKISFVHVFTYSPRKGTVANEMIKSSKWLEVPDIIKKKRSIEITKLVKRSHDTETKLMIGTETNCLIIKKIGNKWKGLTKNGWPINIGIIKQTTNLKGKIVTVKIIDFKEDQLWGKTLLF